MKIGIDLLGADKVTEIVNYINNNDDSSIIIYAYGLEETLALVKNKENVVKVLCTEEVFISDDSARVHRRKKDSSMIKMIADLSDNKIDICVSAGSTGAYMASGLFVVGRIKNVAKPALATMLPTITDHKFLLTDLGANVEAKPEDLLSYAKLSKVYVENMYGKKDPAVALINIGAEENKGNKLYKETHKLFKKNIANFKGNLESRDILNHNYDIIIADGFSGNILLKTIEGVATSIGSLIKNMFLKNIVSKISALLIKNNLKQFKKKFDYSEYGGAILFGIKKPMIKIHGSADEKALYYAVEQAKQIYKTNIYEKMINEFKGE